MAQTDTRAAVPGRGRLLAGLVLGVSLLLPGLAAAGAGPRQVVKTTADQVLQALTQHAGNHHPGELYQLVDRIVIPHMDFQRMSRWVLGRYWRRATPDQRTRFVRGFRNLLVRTYTTALAQYHGQTIDYEPVNLSGGARDVTVHTKIRQTGGPPIPVAYRLHNEHGDWKAYDVIIDGMSLVANYRSTFAAQVRRGGVEGLIRQIAARNQQAGGL